MGADNRLVLVTALATSSAATTTVSAAATAGRKLILRRVLASSQAAFDWVLSRDGTAILGGYGAANAQVDIAAGNKKEGVASASGGTVSCIVTPSAANNNRVALIYEETGENL